MITKYNVANMMSAKLAPIAICCSSVIYLGFIRDRLAVEDAL